MRRHFSVVPVSMPEVEKGLALVHGKDLQEDKEPLFDAMVHLALSLQIVPQVIDGLTVDRLRCLDSAGRGYSSATELADHLVHAGVPFRDAHEVVGRVVRHAIARREPLERLTLEELRAIDAGTGARGS